MGNHWEKGWEKERTKERRRDRLYCEIDSEGLIKHKVRKKRSEGKKEFVDRRHLLREREIERMNKKKYETTREL